MSDNVYWILKCDIRDGQLESLKVLAKEMSEATEREEGAIAYEWHLSSDETSVRIYERFADSEATKVHLDTFDSSFGERFVGRSTKKKR